ncbi:MAG: EamA family transporter [Desulfobacterales bacterium]|jgi:transporter family protein|nr:EamA family transporter [Desulfobacterales bacterium]
MADLFIVLTLLLWGIGAFIGKAVLKEATAISTYLLEAAGSLTVALLICLSFRKDFLSVFSHFNGWGYLFGILWGVGTVTFIVALKYKPASIVVPLTALYPLITALLAVIFLGEAITLKTSAGIVCAIMAAILLG